jgi:hypothetical protein
MTIRQIPIFAFVLALPSRTTGAQAPGDSASSAPNHAITVATSLPADRFVDRRAPIEVSLNRPLTSAEGEIAVVVAGVDVTDLLEKNASHAVYRPGPVPLPSGETEIIVYRRNGSSWTELQRFPLKVLKPGGFVSAGFSPTATIGVSGQLAENHSGGFAEPERRTFQDLKLNIGASTKHEATAWAAESNANALGSSRQEEALRFGELGRAAPQVDLSDYLIGLRRRNTRLSLGHVSVGANRHLVNGFGSRGVTLGAEKGRASLTVGALNGTSIVGWDNLIGLTEANHRVASAILAGELLPRAGALHLDVSLLKGSLRPQTGFTQGAVVDAERSTGGGVQLSASTPGGRLRLAGGYARSRFTNPARDPELLGDTTVQAVISETRGARYVELGVGLLEAKHVKSLGDVSLTAGYKHERIDPLYRSVTASLQADRQQDIVDANFTAGPLTGQVSHTRGHDNLGNVESVLRSLNRESGASLALPLANIPSLKRLGAFAPALSYTFALTHALADGLPTNGSFRPSDLPDQKNTSHEMRAEWQKGRGRLGYRFSHSLQDNRQIEREQADFVALAQSVSLGFTFNPRSQLTSDLSSERQRSKERDELTRVERVAVAWNFSMRTGTSLSSALGATRSRDPVRPDGAINTEARLEVSQALTLRPSVANSSRGTAFLRFGSTTAEVSSGDTPGSTSLRTQRQWIISSGLSFNPLRNQ